MYGFCTNTGTKFIVVVDGRGRRLEAMPDDGVVVAGRKASLGVREMDVKIVRSFVASYCKLYVWDFADVGWNRCSKQCMWRI